MSVGSHQFYKQAMPMPALGYEFMLAPRLSLGIGGSYMTGEYKGETEDYFDNDFVTAYSRRKLTLVPVQLWARYFVYDTGVNILVPYAALGAGVQYADFFITGDNIQTSGTINWGIAVTPEIGLRVYIDSARSIFMDARANWTWGSNKWPVYDNNKSQTRLGIQLAVGFSL